MHAGSWRSFTASSPTGNGRRAELSALPAPADAQHLHDGRTGVARDVIKAAGKGIYVQDVANGQVKIGEGDFAFYVSQGRMIENGKLAAPIKDVNIMGNGPKMLANITMAANDFEFLPWAAAAPAARTDSPPPSGSACPLVLSNP